MLEIIPVLPLRPSKGTTSSRSLAAAGAAPAPSALRRKVTFCSPAPSRSCANWAISEVACRATSCPTRGTKTPMAEASIDASFSSSTTVREIPLPLPATEDSTSAATTSSATSRIPPPLEMWPSNPRSSSAQNLPASSHSQHM